jgi:hypothetical protein
LANYGPGHSFTDKQHPLIMQPHYIWVRLKGSLAHSFDPGTRHGNTTWGACCFTLGKNPAAPLVTGTKG